jgi:hypothetical protein
MTEKPLPSPRSKRLSPQNAIESFAPELLSLLEQGTLGRKVIPGDYTASGPEDDRSLEARQAAAIRGLRHFAARLNQLRNALVKLGDARGPRLYRTKVWVDSDSIALIVEPRDGDIVALIKRAGIDAAPDNSGLDDLDEALGDPS